MGMIAWSWITVVVAAVVVGVTDVMFLVYLPSWIRHGLPPQSIGEPEQCHVHVGDTGGVKQVAAIALSVSTSGDGGGEGGTAEFELSEYMY